MNLVGAALQRIAADLNRYGYRWALVGGFAVSARAEPRFTRDVDVAVTVPDDDEAERLVRMLLLEGYGVVASVEHDMAGRLATVRLGTDPSDFEQSVIVDILFASSGVEAEIVAAAEPLEIIPGVRAPVAVSGHLIALKILARDDERRPQDLADLRALLSVATHADLALARETIQLIMDRSFSREVTTAVDLAHLISGSAPP